VKTEVEELLGSAPVHGKLHDDTPFLCDQADLKIVML
jgi:hypothetical protein